MAKVVDRVRPAERRLTKTSTIWATTSEERHAAQFREPGRELVLKYRFSHFLGRGVTGGTKITDDHASGS